MHTIGSLARRASAAAAAAALLALAACSNDGLPTQPATPRTPPPGALAEIPCTADVRAGTVTCARSAGNARGDIFGGQRVNVALESANVQYNATTEELSFDVTVHNLLLQRMGSDGTTASGVKVFFASGPTTLEGSGLVEVANADGSDVFIASLQPYFAYPPVGVDSVSAPKQWKFHVPGTAARFGFSLYVSAPLVPAIVFEMAPGGNRDIYRMGIDGNDLTRLTTALSTDASPTVAQGRVVFVSYRDGNGELYSVPLSGGAETRLTSTGTGETSPALSPDGTRLAFVRPSGAGTRVYYAKIAGTVLAVDSVNAANAVTSSDAIESTPNWASSTRLAFASTAAASSDIYDVTVGGVATLLAGGANAEVEPAWSPDGTQLAFASNRTRDTELYLVSASTGLVTRVTTRTGSDASPTWLSDGRIVYTCTQGSTLKLCVVDPANPSGAVMIPTPYAASHAAGVKGFLTIAAGQ